MAKMNPKIKEALKDKYVEAFSKVGVTAPALRMAGFSRKALRDWTLEDKDFAQRCEDALEDAIDEAEYVVRQRGVEGWDEPLTHPNGDPIWKREPKTGELCLDEDFERIPLTVTMRNDDLLKFYTKANRAKYGDKSKLELSGPDGGPIATERWIRYVDSDGDGRPDPLDAQHPSEIPNYKPPKED